MNDIEKTLEAVRKKAASLGNLYGRKETADDFLKITYASLYEDAEGTTAPQRDAWVKRQPGYREAVERKRDAYADWKTAETYLKLLFAECDVWRTQEASNRRVDGAHR